MLRNIRFAQVEYLSETVETLSLTVWWHLVSEKLSPFEVLLQNSCGNSVLNGEQERDDMLRVCSTRLSLTLETLKGVITDTQQTFFGLCVPQKNNFYIHFKNTVRRRHLIYGEGPPTSEFTACALPLPHIVMMVMMVHCFPETSSQWSGGKRNAKQMSSCVCEHSQKPNTASMLWSENINSGEMLH